MKVVRDVSTWNVLVVAGIESVLLFGVMLTGLIYLYSGSSDRSDYDNSGSDPSVYSAP